MGVGLKTTIVRIMQKNNSKDKLKKVVELLKFAQSLDDEEIMKSTIESIIEMLQEEINK